MHKRFGFELLDNNPEFKMFSTKCTCNNPDDECIVILTYDKEVKDLMMEFNIKTILYFPWKGFWTNWKMKIVSIFRILFNKSIEMDSEFLFRGRNHIQDFSNMIYELSRDVEKETNELQECREELRRLKNKI